MEYFCSTLEKFPAPARGSMVMLPSPLPQLNIFMCRARWILSPHPTDEGSYTPDGDLPDWMGAVKAFFWLVAAIGSGVLIAGLCG